MRQGPVSYTHLDVYKRQPVDMLIEMDDVRAVRGGTAVSYTHLDVYKRQERCRYRNDGRKRNHHHA